LYLNCHTYYSLRYGMMSPEALVQSALAAGLEGFAVTDINNTSGIIDTVIAAKEKGLHVVAGIDFRNKNLLSFIALAKNNKGFYQINELLSQCNEEALPIPVRAPLMDDVVVIYPYESAPELLLDNEFVGIAPQHLSKLKFSASKARMEKMLVHFPVTFSSYDEFDVHRYLRAIDNNTLLSKIPDTQLATPHEVFLPYDELIALYSDYPRIIQNTNNIFAQLSISFDTQTVKNKKLFSASKYDDKCLLQKLALDGMVDRYGKSNGEARKRILHELEVIDQLGFSSYFLITWDIIKYSMSRGFYHVGRGSGANSIVAYCLRITDVDPIELNLYFERFINSKRSSPPDFDIDFSWKERDAIIDYVFKRYGKRKVALIGTSNTFRDHSIVRELAKVQGLPKEEIDAIIDRPQSLSNEEAIVSTIYKYGSKIMDFPNSRSIHAGGIIVSEDPITCYTALDMPPKGFHTTQWDMYVAEKLAYEKIDILSQRGIGHIADSASIIYQNRGVKIDPHQVELFKKDELVKQQLLKGETIGCFYIESPAMRGLIKKIKCDNYIALVAASSIIRPGVAKSGMMKEYIIRSHHPEKTKYLHPILENLLSETYGVMVYQEDVIKVGHHFAGLDLTDADVLRRAMSGKYRSKTEFLRIKERFFQNCKTKNYPDTISNEVWRQMESFAGYSFSKAHSASFAAESFQSLYLKTYFPIEFMVAVINNFGGFYQSWLYFNEAQRCGATVLPPCVNYSDHLTCVYKDIIYAGFVHIASLELAFAQQIVAERAKHGLYKSLSDFISRLNPNPSQIIILIQVGAFRFTRIKKQQLLWEVHLHTKLQTDKPMIQNIFDTEVVDFVFPHLEGSLLEDAYDELSLLGFPLSMTPFEMLETKFRGEILAKNMLQFVNKKLRMLGRLVCTKYVKTAKNEWMQFGTFIDHKGEFFDSVHFPKSLANYPFKGQGVYLLLGVITSDFDYPSITVEKMAKMPFRKDPRY